jgi:Tfp pilus assembly protein PilF
LLHDEQRAIRIEAARLLAGNPAVQNNRDFIRARQEYIDSEMINADRAAALTNLAGLAIREQRLHDAETLLLSAIQLEPYYIPASINLADLYRMTQRDPDGEKIMLAAMKIVPNNAELNMSYALMLVRKQQTHDALAYLSRAAASGDNPYVSYVYALALQQVGKLPDALKELDRAAAMPVYNRDVQIARIELARTARRDDLARKYLEEWRRTDPDDPAFQNRP